MTGSDQKYLDDLNSPDIHSDKCNRERKHIFHGLWDQNDVPKEKKVRHISLCILVLISENKNIFFNLKKRFVFFFNKNTHGMKESEKYSNKVDVIGLKKKCK